MTILNAGEPESKGNCIASYSSYPFNGLVVTWQCPSPLQVRVISQGKTLETLHHGWELNPGHREDRQ